MIRDQFTAVPTPDALISRIDQLATKQGYTRGVEPFDSDEWQAPADIAPDSNEEHLPTQPTFISEERGVADDTTVHEETINRHEQPQDPTQKNDEQEDASSTQEQDIGDNSHIDPLHQTRRYPARETIRNVTISDAIYAERGGARLTDPALLTTFDLALERQITYRKDWRDKDYAFVMSVQAALGGHGAAAKTVMERELLQFVEKKVFHPVLLRGLNREQRQRILPSKMFLKEKVFPDGTFDKLKARLVAEGHRQDRTMYREEDTSSPTAAYCSVMSVCGVQREQVACCDIGGGVLCPKTK